jgi:hypothetical protein
VKRILALALSALVLAGCGSSGKPATATLKTDSAGVLAASAKALQAAGSSKMSLSNKTTSEGNAFTFAGDGAFDYAAKTGQFAMRLGDKGTLQERIVGGTLYLQVPGQPGWYGLKLSDILDTSLAGSADPTQQLATLVGVSDVQTVGQDTVRGDAVTHYRGTIDVDKALAKLSGAAKDLAQKTFKASGLTELPFDAYVDAQGRMRKYTQELDLKVNGHPAHTSTDVQFYDFGTPVSVVAPPAAEVKDGSPLLAALKNAG